LGWSVLRHAGLDPASRGFDALIYLDSGFRRNDILLHGKAIFSFFVVPDQAGMRFYYEVILKMIFSRILLWWKKYR
jgi:hypothetical protein